MRKILFSLCASIVYLAAQAQQTAPSDHYLIHQYLVNPAAAGLNGTSVFMDYRKQWAGFSGAPETQILTVDGSVNHEKIGLGVMVVNDQVNVLGSTNALATFAYRAKFDEGHFLRLGLSAGIDQNRILFDKIIAQDPSEVQLFQNNQNATSFDAAAGLFYELKELKVGFSVSHLFGENFYYENNFNSNSLKYENIQHYLVNAQYRFNFNKAKWGVMPSLQLRVVQGVSPLAEGALTGYYKKNAWLTLKYSNNAGYTVAIGGVISKYIVAGYAYTLSNKELSGFNNGSHDIILGFRFASKKSGSATDDKTMEELQNKNNELFEKTDFLKSENETLRKELEMQKKALKENIFGLDSLKRKMMEGQDDLKKIILENREKLKNFPDHKEQGDSKEENKQEKNKEKNANSEKSGSVVKGSVSGTDNTSSTDKPETGNPGKIYLVIGAVRTLDVAKQFQKIVSREYSLETQIVRTENDSWYFIYMKTFDDKKIADKEKEDALKLDTKGIFVGNPWLYIVE